MAKRVKLIWARDFVRDIEKSKIVCGELPAFIPAGTETWVGAEYLETGGNVHIENNKYLANIPRNFFIFPGEEGKIQDGFIFPSL